MPTTGGSSRWQSIGEWTPADLAAEFDRWIIPRVLAYSKVCRVCGRRVIMVRESKRDRDGYHPRDPKTGAPHDCGYGAVLPWVTIKRPGEWK
jgi:hypothetical protein